MPYIDPTTMQHLGASFFDKLLTPKQQARITSSVQKKLSKELLRPLGKLGGNDAPQPQPPRPSFFSQVPKWVWIAGGAGLLLLFVLKRK